MHMERLPPCSDDILAYRAGDLRRALLAGLCGLAGVALLKLTAMLMRSQSMAAGLLALAAAGLTFGGIIGVVRSLGRTGIVLDRAEWRGHHLALPLRAPAYDNARPGAFWTVLFSAGRVQERYRARTVYLVGLHGEVGEPLLLTWDVDYQAARRFGEEVAGFLGFPFSDAAGTDPVIHPPGKTAVAPPFGQPPAVRHVPRPASLQCGIAWHDDTLVVEEPRIGWGERLGGPLIVFVVLAPALLAIGAYYRYFTEPSRIFVDPLTAAAVVVGMLLVMLVAIVLSSLPQLGQRRRVAANGEGLHFRTEGLFASRDRHLRRADIRELRIAFGHLVAVTPRDYRVICGRLHHPLARAELEWLRDQLTRALQGLGGTE